MKLTPFIRALEHLDDDLLLEVCRESAQAEAARAAACMRRRRRRRGMAWGALAAALLLVLSGAWMLTGRLSAEPDEPALTQPLPTAPVIPARTTIAFDVNPSLSLEVNTAGRVADIRAHNQEAAAVVSELDVTGHLLDDAVDAIVAALLRHGYLTVECNSILVSVDADDGGDTDILQKYLADRIAACSGGDAIAVSVIAQSYDRDDPALLTEAGGISAAKASFIQKILAAELKDTYGKHYTYEQLEPLNITDLKLLLECKGLSVEGLTVWSADSGDAVLAPEEALSIVVSDSGKDADQIADLQVDYDMVAYLNTAIYSIRFTADGEDYTYRLLAESGDILNADSAGDVDRDFRLVYRPVRVIRRKLISMIRKEYSISINDVPCEFKRSDEGFVYQSEFSYEGCHYTFVINAETGEVLSEQRLPQDAS